ncbi:MAG: hypothetical protein ACFFDW_17685, partial [Candidatus Thorarchaeota archaeon]
RSAKNMGLVGAFILPHGAMILDPKKKNIPQGAINLHHSMKNIAVEIEKLKPELIFITTPHSIALSNDFGIYLNKRGSGSAEWNNEYSEFKVDIPIDQDISNQLLDYLLEKETAIHGIATFTPSVNAPFRWGEAVPLWFLKDLHTKPKYIVLSQPLRRLDQAKELIPETVTLGNDLRLFFDSLDKRVVVIISADLAHTHQNDGPYGFSEEAEIFDKMLEEWAGNLDEKILTKKLVPKLNNALCCGYIGFVILQGMIEHKGFTPKVLIRETPSYYGMMIASYKEE